MKILLTGASGFIGNFLLNQWTARSHEVIGILRRPIKQRVSCRIIQTDLSQGVPLDEGVDVIVHTAAQAPKKGVCVSDFISSNALATQQLIQYAKTYGVPKFIYLSSVSIYGHVNVPVLDENSPIVNPDIYGTTKYLGELLLKDETRHFCSIAIRLPGVVGKHAKGIWLSTIVQNLAQNKDVTIFNPDAKFNNLVHLIDLEKFISTLLMADWKGFKAALLGCREPITIMETVNILKHRLHSTSMIHVVQNNKPAFNISTASAVKLGYEPMNTAQALKTYSQDIRSDSGEE